MLPLSIASYHPFTEPPSPERPRFLAVEDVPWPEPESLHVELPPVPGFDPALLPSSLRPMVMDVAERMQVPEDYPAAAAVAALSAAVGRRALIQPKREDATWTVVPNLWGAVIAPPGAMKSAVLSAMTAPLRAIESKWREEDAKANADHGARKEKAELELQTWRDAYRVAQKAGKDLPERPSFDLVPPAARRLLCSDATFESLHTLLAENPGGLFVLRDELAGWLAGLERQGREQERAFALESWNGDSSFTMDRIGRGRVHVDHCCVSIFGGIQPARIRGYLSDTLRDGPLSDGLIQRFGLLVWPDERRNWRYVDRNPDRAAMERAADVLHALVSLDPSHPLVLRFTPEAQLLFREWLGELECRIRSREVSPALQAHLAKYRKLMPALALLFALADGSRDAVALSYAQQAAAWTEYLEAHARRLYSSQCSSERGAAITLGVRLSGGWRKTEGCFSLRDVYRNQWEGLTNPQEARAAVTELESMGWLRRIPEPAGKHGRTSERYAINPLLEERHGNGQ